MSAFDLACPACSKPFRSGSLVLFQDGEIIHIRCRTQALRLDAIEEVERAHVAQERSAQLLDEVARRREGHLPRLSSRRATCPVCAEMSTFTDWRPNAQWIAVEGCSCLGYLVAVHVLQERLPHLTATETLDLARRIRRVRVFGREAWITTANADPEEPLVVRTERPDRPT